MEFYDIQQKDQVPNTQLEIQAKKQQEYKFIGKARRIPGLTMFSFNYKTGEIKPAPLEEECIVDFRSGEVLKNAHIKVEKYCIYRQALNRKNFLKILCREGIIVKVAKQTKSK